MKTWVIVLIVLGVLLGGCAAGCAALILTTVSEIQDSYGSNYDLRGEVEGCEENNYFVFSENYGAEESVRQIYVKCGDERTYSVEELDVYAGDFDVEVSEITNSTFTEKLREKAQQDIGYS